MTEGTEHTFETTMSGEVGASATHPPDTELDEYGDPIVKNEDEQ